MKFSQRIKAKLVMHWPMLLLLAMVTACLLLSSVTSSCSHTEKDAPVVVVVEKGQVVKDDEPGWWRVTDGWLMRRMEYEQSLQYDLEQCQGEIVKLWRYLDETGD